jgi:ATP-dependent Zn protease
VEQERATSAADLPQVDAFRSLAEGHRSTVKHIRESNRQRRLRYLFYLNLVIFSYLIARLLEDRPLDFGLPSLGPDAMMWMFPIAMVFIVAFAMMLPFVLSGRAAHLRYSPEEIGLGFDDVRGIDVVLEEVTRSLQIFLAYKSFQEDLGGNPRRGLLFEGTPGTGKTHLAKAMAAEAGVPFYFVSAPAFQSMMQGMTAFKIRKFFKALKKAARKEGGAIGFIEEIDAIAQTREGMSRMAPTGTTKMVSSMFGSNDNGASVNELLIQLQSFEAPSAGGRFRHGLVDMLNMFMPAEKQIKKGQAQYNNVLVIAATNRADTLDPALLRPGRFDRILHFDLPSRMGRRELIDYFLAKRSHEPEMDREDLRQELASMTLGYTPAMLEHILDESLVWALRDGRRSLNWEDVQRARLSEEIGLAQPVAYTERERELIATHEAGHAVTAYLCAKDRRLEVLSIIKRRSALGLLAHSDTEERFTKTKSELEGTLRITLGGMVAEELFFGESGTGPSGDLMTATSLAASMIGSFGMGASLISYEAVSHGPSAANLVAKVLSDDEGKREMQEILRSHKDHVTLVLESKRHLIEALRDALLEKEELLGDEILAVIQAAEVPDLN